jgi:hypothetical protein
MKTILDRLIESINQGIETSSIDKKSGDVVKWYINTYYIYQENEFIKSIREEERASIHLDT